MKAWKYLVLIGGIAGVAGFFLPFITFQSTDGQLAGSFSAYQVVRGIDDAGALIDTAKPITATHADAQRIVTTINTELARYRGALIACFVPAVVLAVLGALVGARRKMGRIAGILAMLVGLVNAGVWLVFFQISTEQPDLTAGMGAGLHMLLVAGALGCIAGLGALLAPDRGYAD
ncbi:MAG TPA: hypothetical protein VIV11_03350 [Kofleriaceae bacterium]